jgi:hypothetical protein
MSRRCTRTRPSKRNSHTSDGPLRRPVSCHSHGDRTVIDFLYHSILIGIGATAVFDLWGLFLRYAFGLPGANWGLVGRWFCHLAGGTVYHEDIAKARPFAYERAWGWIGHYAVGILFAAILLAVVPSNCPHCGPRYGRRGLVPASTRHGRRHRCFETAQCEQDQGSEHRRTRGFRTRPLRECPSHPLRHQEASGPGTSLNPCSSSKSRKASDFR